MSKIKIHSNDRKRLRIELNPEPALHTKPLISPTNCASAVLTSLLASKMLVQASLPIRHKIEKKKMLISLVVKFKV